MNVLVFDIETIPDIRMLLYRERGWADHQDVVVIGKPAFDKIWPRDALCKAV